MTKEEFVENVRGFLNDSKSKEEFKTFKDEFQVFVEAAKEHDPILAEHVEQLLIDMQHLESYVETFYKLP